MKNSRPQWDSIPGPPARKTDALIIAPRSHLNVKNYKCTILILISIFIAPRAQVKSDRLLYHVSQCNTGYWPFLQLTIVDYFSSRKQRNTRENTFESASDDDKER